jgi:hypothetical protein
MDLPFQRTPPVADPFMSHGPGWAAVLVPLRILTVLKVAGGAQASAVAVDAKRRLYAENHLVYPKTKSGHK